MIANLIITERPGAVSIPVAPDAVTFLTENAVPISVIESLTQVAYLQWMAIREHCIAPVNGLRSLNTEKLYLPWFQDGYLTVGGGLNGDPVAIDLTTMRMCYINHDEMFPRQDCAPSKSVLHTPLSFAGFWAGAANAPNFPVDSYSAEDLWGRHPRQDQER